jgi:alpha-methylacyl-CoA racemase
VGQGIGVQGSGWSQKLLESGTGGEEVLGQWLGWKRGRQYNIEGDGLVLNEGSKL